MKNTLWIMLFIIKIDFLDVQEFRPQRDLNSSKRKTL